MALTFKAAAAFHWFGTDYAEGDPINTAGYTAKDALRLLRHAPVYAIDETAAEAYADTKVAKAGDAMSGDLAMASHRITGLADPAADQDAATKAHVATRIAALVNSAPAILDTLGEIATQLQSDESAAAALLAAVALKAPLASPAITGAPTKNGSPIQSKAESDGTYLSFAPAASGDTTGADDTAVLQPLLTALGAAGGGTLQLRYAPASAPYYTTGLRLPSNVVMQGVSKQGTVLQAPLGQAAGAHLLQLVDDNTYGVGVRRLTLNGGNGRAGSQPLQANLFDLIHFVNVTPPVSGMFGGLFTDNCWDVQDVMLIQSPQHGMYLSGRISSGYIKNVYALWCYANSYYIGANDLFFDNCNSGASGYEGFYVTGNGSLMFNQCKSWYSGEKTASRGDGFFLSSGSYAATLTGCYAQDNYHDGFSVAGTTHRITGKATGNQNSHVALRGATSSHVDVTLDNGWSNFQHAAYEVDWSGTNSGNIVKMDGDATANARTPVATDISNNSVQWMNSRRVDQTTLSAADVTVSSTSYVSAGATTLLLAAAVGQYVRISVTGRWGPQAVEGRLDVATIVSAAPVHYVSGQGATGLGVPGCIGTNGVDRPFAASVLYKITAGDLDSSGVLNLQLRVKVASATSKTLYASAASGVLSFSAHLMDEVKG